MTFEDFLRNEIHPQLFPQLLDDDMPDHFDNWLGEIDTEDLIGWADIFGQRKIIEGMDRAINKFKE